MKEDVFKTELQYIKDNEIRSIDDIHEEIFEIIKKEIDKEEY